MRRKIISIVLSLMLLFPAMFLIAGCGPKEVGFNVYINQALVAENINNELDFTFGDEVNIESEIVVKSTFDDNSEKALLKGENGYNYTITPVMSNIPDAKTYLLVIIYKEYASIEINIVVSQAEISPNIQMSKAEYDYLENIPAPTVEGNSGSGEVNYYYKKSATDIGTLWTAETVLSAGDYLMYAQIGETNNYFEKTTSPVAFKVNPLKVSRPTLDTSKTYTYNQTAQTVALNNFDGNLMNITGNVQTNASENYVATISLKDSTNYEWNDETSSQFSISWTIGKLKVLRPTLDTSKTYTYNQTAQTVALNNFDGNLMNITGNVQTNASENYMVNITLKDSINYAWSTEGNSGVVISWKINPMQVAKPTLDISKTYTYNGSNQTVELIGYTNLMAFVSGNSAKNAGNYEAIIRLVNSENYEWNDETSSQFSISWQINKLQITKPTLKAGETYTYNASEQTILLDNFDAETMSISNNKRTNAGTQLAEIVLKNTVNYEWTDGSILKVEIPFEILQLELTKPTLNTFVTYTYSGITQKVGLLDFNALLMDIVGDEKTDAGNYTATISLKDAINYVWKDKTNLQVDIAWSINKKAQTTSLKIDNFVYSEENEMPYAGNAFSLSLDSEVTEGTTFSVQNKTGSATVILNDLTLTACGTVDVTISNAGDNNYEAVNKIVTVTFAKGEDYLSYQTQELSFKYNENGILFTNPLTNTSDIQPTFGSSNTDVIEVDNQTSGQMKMLKAGNSTIAAICEETQLWKAETAFYSVQISLNDGVLNFQVDDADYNGTNTALTPQLSSTTNDVSQAVISYSLDGQSYTIGLPTNAGTYYIRAEIPANEQYEAVTEIVNNVIIRKIDDPNFVAQSQIDIEYVGGLKLSDLANSLGQNYIWHDDTILVESGFNTYIAIYNHSTSLNYNSNYKTIEVDVLVNAIENNLFSVKALVNNSIEPNPLIATLIPLDGYSNGIREGDTDYKFRLSFPEGYGCISLPELSFWNEDETSVFYFNQEDLIIHKKAEYEADVNFMQYADLSIDYFELPSSVITTLKLKYSQQNLTIVKVSFFLEVSQRTLTLHKPDNTTETTIWSYNSVFNLDGAYLAYTDASLEEQYFVYGNLTITQNIDIYYVQKQSLFKVTYKYNGNDLAIANVVFNTEYNYYEMTTFDLGSAEEIASTFGLVSDCIGYGWQNQYLNSNNIFYNYNEYSILNFGKDLIVELKTTPYFTIHYTGKVTKDEYINTLEKFDTCLQPLEIDGYKHINWLTDFEGVTHIIYNSTNLIPYIVNNEITVYSEGTELQALAVDDALIGSWYLHKEPTPGDNEEREYLLIVEPGGTYYYANTNVLNFGEENEYKYSNYHEGKIYIDPSIADPNNSGYYYFLTKINNNNEIFNSNYIYTQVEENVRTFIFDNASMQTLTLGADKFILKINQLSEYQDYLYIMDTLSGINLTDIITGYNSSLKVYDNLEDIHLVENVISYSTDGKVAKIYVFQDEYFNAQLIFHNGDNITDFTITPVNHNNYQLPPCQDTETEYCFGWYCVEFERLYNSIYDIYNDISSSETRLPQYNFTLVKRDKTIDYSNLDIITSSTDYFKNNSNGSGSTEYFIKINADGTGQFQYNELYDCVYIYDLVNLTGVLRATVVQEGQDPYFNYYNFTKMANAIILKFYSTSVAFERDVLVGGLVGKTLISPALETESFTNNSAIQIRASGLAIIESFSGGEMIFGEYEAVDQKPYQFTIKFDGQTYYLFYHIIDNGIEIFNCTTTETETTHNNVLYALNLEYYADYSTSIAQKYGIYLYQNGEDMALYAIYPGALLAVVPDGDAPSVTYYPYYVANDGNVYIFGDYVFDENTQTGSFSTTLLSFGTMNAGTEEEPNIVECISFMLGGEQKNAMYISSSMLASVFSSMFDENLGAMIGANFNVLLTGTDFVNADNTSKLSFALSENGLDINVIYDDDNNAQTANYVGRISYTFNLTNGSISTYICLTKQVGEDTIDLIEKIEIDTDNSTVSLFGQIFSVLAV